MNEFTEKRDRLLQHLSVDQGIGLTDAQVQESRKANGANSFTKE